MKYVNTIVTAIRSYTNRAFIGGYYKGTIELTEKNISMELRPESIIEIRGSEFNDGFYWVDENQDVEGLSPETYDGYVVFIKIPLDMQILKDMNKVLDKQSSNPGVKRQQIENVSFTTGFTNSDRDVIGGIPKSMLSSLTMYRRLPNKIEEEYYHAGII